MNDNFKFLKKMTVKKALLFALLIVPFNGINGQHFNKIDTLTLEETEEVLLSSPAFGVITGNKIIVTDEGTHQVIIYSDKGRLINSFGQYGRGPGDFEQPTSATELPSGEILVTEFNGQISKFDSSGKLLAITQTEIIRLNNSRLLPNGKVLLVGGMHSPEDHFLLYLFNPESMSIDKKFFLLPFDPAEYAMQPLTLAEPSFAVVCSDKIVAAHSMLTVIFYYDFEGNLIENKKIDSDLFSQMEKVSNPNNPREAMENYGNASWIVNMFCVANNDVLIQFFTNLRDEGNPASLMLVNENGEVIKESLDMPQVLFSNHATDTLFFRDEESGLVNQIIKSKLIRE